MAARGLFIDGSYLLPAGEAEFSSESRYVLEGKAAMENNCNNFPVDDLLNFSVEDEVMADTFFDSVTGESSTVTGVDSCNSSISGGGGCNFNGNLGCRSFTDAAFPPPSEICVPAARALQTRFHLRHSAPTNCSTANAIPRAATKTAPYKRRENSETPGRKCLHCASEKTPQWRTGPLGPKTLCNACGVRQASIFGISNGAEDYLLHHHLESGCPDFRHMI
nr:GATA transcription factor 9-like [Ipomoea batatas]